MSANVNGAAGNLSADASQSQGAALLSQARGDADSRDSAKILKAGRDFESILLGGWLQGAEKSFAAAPGADTDEDQDQDSGQMMGIAMQQLASTLVASGGIGIARMISDHLQKAATRHVSAASLPAADSKE